MLSKELKIKKKFCKIDMSSYGEKNFVNSLAMLYHENSKLTPIASRILGLTVNYFNNEMFHKRASQPFKIYPGTKFLSFDEFKDIKIPDVNLFATIESRRSVRHYNKYQINLNDLFYLCHYSYGISLAVPIRDLDYGHWYYRNVPSGGGLYPLELYIVVFEGTVDPGIYHYRPDKNGLEFLKEGHFYSHLNSIITAEPIIEFNKASCVIFTTSVFERVLIKYGDRGYRFILLETGFVSQNISLLCEAIGLGSCMVGGYLDDDINNFLEVDGLAETVQNVIIIGKNNKSDEAKGVEANTQTSSN